MQARRQALTLAADLSAITRIEAALAAAAPPRPAHPALTRFLAWLAGR